MILEDVAEFAAALPRNRAVIGLDLGEKTIGLALSDLRLGTATPFETIRRKKFTLDAARLMEVITARDVGGMVMGLPRNMDGSEGPRCQKARAFLRNLQSMTDMPMTLWDERLSTVAAERALLEADTSRAKRAEVIDHVAAAYILQGALDRMAHIRGQSSD